MGEFTSHIHGVLPIGVYWNSRHCFKTWLDSSPFLELCLGPLLSEGSEISVITMIFRPSDMSNYFVLEVQVARVCKLLFFFPLVGSPASTVGLERFRKPSISVATSRCKHSIKWMRFWERSITSAKLQWTSTDPPNSPHPIHPVMNVASQNGSVASEAQAVALLLILAPDRLAASSASVALSANCVDPDTP